MESEFDNKLTVSIEDGTNVTIKVLDIVESNVYNKTFIIYSLLGDDKTLFASILKEDENNFNLENITSKEEMNYIDSEISRVINESSEEK